MQQETPTPNLSEQRNKILLEIDKDIVIHAGKVFLHQEYSIWIVDHQHFGSQCSGKIYIVAQADNENKFSSIGASCTGCKKPINLNIKISKEELERKISEDELKMVAVNKLISIGLTNYLDKGLINPQH